MLYGCLVQVGNGIELEAVGLLFEPYRWRPCGVTWDSSRTVVVIKLRRTSALYNKKVCHLAHPNGPNLPLFQMDAEPKKLHWHWHQKAVTAFLRLKFAAQAE